MKRFMILWLMVAATALGANLINVSAYKTTDGACDTGIDSTVVLAYWNAAAVKYFAPMNATGTGCFDTTLTVDSIGLYSVVIKWYNGGVQIGADNQRASSWAASAPLATNVTQIDGLATATGAAGLKLKKLTIANDTGDAAVFVATGDNGIGLTATGNGTGAGGLFTGGVSAHGLLARADGSGYNGLHLYSGSSFGLGFTSVGDVGCEPNFFDSAAFYSNYWTANRRGNALSATGTDADTSFTNMQTTLAAVKAKTDKLTYNAADSLIIDYSNIPGGTATVPDSLFDSLTAIHADVNSITSGTIYPLLGDKFTVDAAGTNARTQFVVDTASLGTFSSNWQAIRDRSYLLRSMSDNKVQIPLIIHSVAYTGANCTLTVADSVPIAFAAGDTIQMTGIYSPELASLSEAAAATSDSTVAKDTTGLRGDPTVGGMIMSGGSSSSDTTDIKAMLDNNLFTQAKDTLNLIATTTGNGRLPRYGELPAITQAGLDSLAATAKRLNDTLTSQEWAGVGSGDDPAGVRFVVRVWDGTNSAAVPGARVTIRPTLTATVYDHQKDANASGNAIFTIDTASYYVFVESPGLSFPDSAYHITGADSILMSGTGISILPPASATQCRFAMSLSVPPFANAEAKFALLNATGDIAIDSTSDAAIQTVIYGSANSSGVLQKDLNKNAFIYLLRLNRFNTTEWEYRIRPKGSSSWEAAPIVGRIRIPADSTYFRPQGGK